jgi:hypothetical protein
MLCDEALSTTAVMLIYIKHGMTVAKNKLGTMCEEAGVDYFKSPTLALPWTY